MTTQHGKATDEATIRKLIEDRAKAARAKDINGLMSNHAPDILAFDVVNPLKYTGSDALRGRAEEWFSLYQGPIARSYAQVTNLVAVSLLPLPLPGKWYEDRWSESRYVGAGDRLLSED